MKLTAQLVEKPWGRTRLPPMFGQTSGQRVGEVWFVGRDDLPLLAKYIFTSEPLSIQNHPNDQQAQSRGLTSGKEECWFVLEADQGATLGLGLKREVEKSELRQSALDGSIVELIDWKPVKTGDFYYVPSGTVHAIGAGISLLEFQQNADITYRIYDYGRPRELHLEDGISIATIGPYADDRARWVDPGQAAILVNGPRFTIAHVIDGQSCGESFKRHRRWVLPIDGVACSGDLRASPGECLLVEAGAELELCGRALIGAEGSLDNP